MGYAMTWPHTALLATDKPVLMAPAMNVRMWEHAAMQANLATLKGRGRAFRWPPMRAKWRAGSLAPDALPTLWSLRCHRGASAA